MAQRTLGKKHFFLAGLSAGAIGAAEMYKDFSADFEGLLLLFGAHPNTDKVLAPTLYIFAQNDERIPQRWVRRFADDQRMINSQVEIFGLPGDHFLIAKEPAKVQEIIYEWMRKHLPTSGH